MKKKAKNGGAALADPTQLKPFAKKRELLKVIVETPKGCRNKYAFDPDEQIFKLKRVLPAGMTFPYDFGFVPRTKAEDGDPVDVLILMDEPAFTGCLIKCRLIGVIEGEQEKNGTKLRNDRLVAIEESNHVYMSVDDINQLPKQLLREIGEFFVNYHALRDQKFRVLAHKGLDEAQMIVDQGLKAA
jgi:inorganic pyrophosphatase